MKTILKSLLYSGVAVAVIFGGVKLAQRPTQVLGCVRPVVAEHNYDRTWMTESLSTSNDAPFLARRLVIDRVFRESTPEEQTGWLDAYKKDALNNTDKAEPMFGWAYMAFLVQRDREWKLTYDQNKHLICGIYEWMGQPPAPHSFEYTRLRFILGVIADWYDRATRQDGARVGSDSPTIELAKRLLKQFPADLQLQRYAAVSLGSYGSDSDRSQIMVYAQQYKKVFPKRPESYLLMAGGWGGRFNTTYSSSDLDKSIAYKRQFLKLPSINSEHIERIIKSVGYDEDTRVEYKKRGLLKP